MATPWDTRWAYCTRAVGPPHHFPTRTQTQVPPHLADGNKLQIVWKPFTPLFETSLFLQWMAPGGGRCVRAAEGRLGLSRVVEGCWELRLSIVQGVEGY